MCFAPDCPPDTVDDLLYALEEACANSGHQETPKEVIARTSQAEAGWLACAVREKLAKDRETMGDEIAQRLEVRQETYCSHHVLQHHLCLFCRMLVRHATCEVSE